MQEYVMQAMLSKQDSDTAMGRLFKRIAELTGAGFDTIIHVGAGAGAELDDYQRLGFERLLLVEGDAESAEELRATVHDRNGVEVVEQVVAPEAGPAVWHRYNLPVLNSVLSAGDLSTLYPRLRVMSRERVQAVSLQELLERVVLNLAGRNLLFLDVPGTEDALLANVPEGLLHAFEWIAVHGNQCAGYEGGTEIDPSVARLKEHGFRLEALNSETDLNWPVALLHRDKTLLENKKLHAKIADLSGTIEAYATSEQAQQAKLVAVSAERDKHVKLADEREKQAYALTLERAQLVEQLAKSHVELKAVAEANAAQQKLVTEQQGRIEALSQQRGEQAKLAADRHTQIQQLTQERDAHAKHLADLQARLEQADHIKAEYEALATERQAVIHQLADARDAQAKLVSDRDARIQELSRELGETQQAASLALKLQALREADLTDIRERYAMMHESKRRQDELLIKLTQRLDLTAKYLHEINAQDGAERLKEILIGGPSKALPDQPLRKAQS